MLLLFLLCAAPLWAAQDVPVKITSDTMTYSQKGDQVVFKGSVYVIRQDIELWSNTLTVLLEKKEGADNATQGVVDEQGSIKKIIAQGNVRIKADKGRTGTCGKATYEADKDLLTMDEAIAAVREAFYDHGIGRTQMPPKSYLYFSPYEGDLRSMPAYLERVDQAGVKTVNVHPRNAAIGLPTVMALLTLVSPKTGAPLAIMGATHLTAMRTGAAGAVAARLLAREESRTVGMIGAGVQARAQLLGIRIRSFSNSSMEEMLLSFFFESSSFKTIKECSPLFVVLTGMARFSDPGCPWVITAPMQASGAFSELWKG